MSQQSIIKSQKPNDSVLASSGLFQRKAINRSGFGVSSVDTNNLSRQQKNHPDFSSGDSGFDQNFTQIPVRLNSPSLSIQAKLKIGQPNDKYEQEADQVAEQVMRMSDPRLTTLATDSALINSTNPHNGTIQRTCTSCSAEYKKAEDESGPVHPKNLCFKCQTQGQGQGQGQIQTKQITPLVQTKTTSETTPEVTPEINSDIQALQGGGRPLSDSERSFFEPRFGTGFSHVRVHNDRKANQSAVNLAAQAYTVGSNIVFGANQYVPTGLRGRRLIAHELTHVIQQKNVVLPNTILQRQGVPEASTIDADIVAEREYANSGAPKAQKCGRPSHCPPGFCDPYKSEKLAKYYRGKKSWWLLIGISAVVDSRVVPLWQEYLMGGSSPKNLSAQFGNDFTKSRTTKNTTSFLHQELEKKLKASPPNIPEFTTVSINLSSEIPKAIAQLGNPASSEQMNFNIPKEIPGNIAGGIGKDQKSCPAGANPSPFNDERHASGYAMAVRNGSNIIVTPIIEYIVKDTIDLCPGDCGTGLEQVATVPLSQFEATGISGDVPFTVKFPAPSLGSFTIPAP